MLKLVKLPDGYIRLSDAAKEMGISYQTIRSWTTDGLVAYKLGKKLVYTSHTDIHNYLQAKKEQQTILPNKQAKNTPVTYRDLVNKYKSVAV